MLFRQLLEQSSKLQRLVQTSAQMDQLNNLLKITLNDTKLSNHCHLAKLKKEELVIVVDNAAWATRLRYMTPDLIKNLRIHPEFAAVANIRYKVVANMGGRPQQTAPNIPIDNDSSRPTPTISSKSSQAIKAIAKHIKNPALRSALLHLATSNKTHS